MKKLLITITACAALSLSAFGKTPVKILTVDLNDVLNKYTKVQDSQKKIQAALITAEEDFNKMREALIDSGKEYEELIAKSKNPALSEDARKRFEEQASSSQESLQKQQAELQQFLAQTNQTLEQRRASILKLHLSEIKDAVAKIAIQQDATFVINGNQIEEGGPLLYISPEYDITKETLQALNKTSSTKASSARPSR